MSASTLHDLGLEGLAEGRGADALGLHDVVVQDSLHLVDAAQHVCTGVLVLHGVQADGHPVLLHVLQRILQRVLFLRRRAQLFEVVLEIEHLQKVDFSTLQIFYDVHEYCRLLFCRSTEIQRSYF